MNQESKIYKSIANKAFREHERQRIVIIKSNLWEKIKFKFRDMFHRKQPVYRYLEVKE